MNIYKDPIGDALGIRNIFEIYPNLTPEELVELPLPEDNKNYYFDCTGFTHSSETKLAISKSLKGVANVLGLVRSEENKKRVAEARRNAPRKPCPRCGKMFQANGLARHFQSKNPCV